jgi:hypothetical protein
MRISQNAAIGLVPAGRAGDGTGGWLQVADMMGRRRFEDVGLTAQTKPPCGQGGAASATLGQAMEAAIDLAGVRMEKVARLRAAIASGRYRVSAKQIADRMMRRLMEEAMWPRGG